MPEEIDNKLLNLLGKLALAQSFAFNARCQLQDLIDEHEIKKAGYSDRILIHINRGMKDIEHAEFTLGDSICDISTGFSKKRKYDNELANNGDT